MMHRVKGMSCQVPENGPPELRVNNHKVASIPDILIKTSQICGEGLIGVIPGIIDVNGFIKCWIVRLVQVDPIIHTTQVIDQGTSTEGPASCDPVGPDQGSMNSKIVPEITTDYKQVRFGFIDLTIGLPKYLPSHSTVKVGP